MFFIILGAGEVGTRVAQILSAEGHEVVLIEREKKRVSNIYNKIDCRLIIDEGIQTNVLEEAGIQQADYFIATTNFDEKNLIACLLVQKIAPHVKNIARIREEDFMSDSRKSLFPIDYVVHPERAAALSIIRSIEIGGGVSDVFLFKNFGDLRMRSFFINDDSMLIGTKLKDLQRTLNLPENIQKKFLIALINRKDEAIIPTGDFEFLESDVVYLVGEPIVLEQYLQIIGKTVSAARYIKRIIILGASPLAKQIIEYYQNTRETKLSSLIGKRRFANKEITVIDDDLEKCNEFAEEYQDVSVLHADIAAEDVLEDLEIGEADMLIASTAMQERNIVLAAHSHHLGVPHTIALVQTPIYFTVAASLGVSMTLSIRSEVVSAIISFLRGSTSLYTLVEGSYGIFECKVDSKSSVIDKMISNIVMPAKSLILCTSTDDKNDGAIASGNTVIKANDTLLCISHPESIDKLHALFGIETIVSKSATSTTVTEKKKLGVDGRTSTKAASNVGKSVRTK